MFIDKHTSISTPAKGLTNAKVQSQTLIVTTTEQKLNELLKQMEIMKVQLSELKSKPSANSAQQNNGVESNQSDANQQIASRSGACFHCQSPTHQIKYCPLLRNKTPYQGRRQQQGNGFPPA